MLISRVQRYGLATLLSVGLAATQGAQAQTANCKYVVTNSWGAGATASIEITNTGTTNLNGWTVGWTYVNNRLTSSWNATVSGSNPYSASNVGWNGNLKPGQTVSFGVQVATNGAVETPAVTGAICSGTTSSASSLSSSLASSSLASSVRSSSSSVVTSSSRSSSSSLACPSGLPQQCNWYGTLHPLCKNTTSGWGYENGKSCIANSTCASQPAPYGVLSSGCPISSSSASSIKSSSSSLVSSSVKSSSSSLVSSSIKPSSSSLVSSSVKSSSSSLVSSSVKSSSSVSSSVLSSSSSVRSSSSVSSSSSSTGSVIPNATGGGVAYCRSGDSDPDGDGWGWENSASCVVFGSAADSQGVGNFSYCVIGSSKLDLCTTDTGSWGSQSGKVCLSKSMCPGMGSATQGPARSA
ncbi:MAG: cellulose binding domain-containing protein, partial [Cellvibrio sp.]